MNFSKIQLFLLPEHLLRCCYLLGFKRNNVHISPECWEWMICLRKFRLARAVRRNSCEREIWYWFLKGQEYWVRSQPESYSLSSRGRDNQAPSLKQWFFLSFSTQECNSFKTCFMKTGVPHSRSPDTPGLEYTCQLSPSFQLTPNKALELKYRPQAHIKTKPWKHSKETQTWI